MELKPKLQVEPKATPTKPIDNIKPNVKSNINAKENYDGKENIQNGVETKETKREKILEESKTKRKTLKEKILEGSPMSRNIMHAFKKFFVAYLSVMRKLSKDWGFDISDLENSKMTQKMGKNDILDKIQKRVIEKTKMKKIPKKAQIRLSTKTILDPNKDLGLFMFNGLGIKPLTLHPKKAYEVNQRPKPNMYLNMLMVQLKASGFENAFHDQSIVDGMLKTNSEGKRKFYKGDPIFFRTPDGKSTAGFLEGFKNGKFIIQTINQDGSKTILKEIHQKHVFTAFHIQGNRIPVNHIKTDTPPPNLKTQKKVDQPK